jgi:hypothetical protein
MLYFASNYNWNITMRKLFHSVLIITLITFISPAIFANGVAPSKKVPYYGKLPAPIMVALVPGSLKANIIRISHQYGWHKVIWDSQYDYSWESYTKIRRNRLQDILSMILANYPLQAIFYTGNNIVVIKPRTLR